MGANFGDLNNDGFPDFYLGTGYPNYEALMPNLMYLNQAGKRFADVTTVGGFGHLQKGHGIAFADIDNDGDQDIFSEMEERFQEIRQRTVSTKILGSAIIP
ncbi:MAG: VCBS repeat-containing protein [Pirellulaceae bacterium]